MFERKYLMPQIVVVYHSGYGHTQRMAQAVAEGAQAELIAIDADGNLPASAWDRLAQADALILGSPTYMGTVSWQFKKFADASSKAWYAQAWRDKLFAGFTNSAAVNAFRTTFSVGGRTTACISPVASPMRS